jgi:hypothetical protein
VLKTKPAPIAAPTHSAALANARRRTRRSACRARRDRRRDRREPGHELRHDDREEPVALEDPFGLAHAGVGRQRDAAQELEHAVAVAASAKYQSRSAITDAATAIANTPAPDSRAVAAIAPATIIVGTAGIGRPSCCRKTLRPTERYAVLDQGGGQFVHARCLRNAGADPEGWGRPRRDASPP